MLDPLSRSTGPWTARLGSIAPPERTVTGPTVGGPAKLAGPPSLAPPFTVMVFPSVALRSPAVLGLPSSTLSQPAMKQQPSSEPLIVTGPTSLLAASRL